MIVTNGQLSWNVNEHDLLGRAGGFGAVYSGTDLETGEVVAIKMFNEERSEQADREIQNVGRLIGRNLAHVIPYYAADFDEQVGGYFIVMGKGEFTLEDHGTCNSSELVSILISIFTGLQEVGDLVHRDLKPDNIIFHGGAWKVMDFGISKFDSANTSVETLRGFLTKEYASPEQFSCDRPTHASDVYSVGCIAHFLASGFPPFQAGDIYEYKECHLFDEPPQLETNSPTLASLVGKMLAKRGQSRPSILRAVEALKSIQKSLDTGKAPTRLAQANAQVVKDYTQREAEEGIKKRAEDESRALCEAGAGYFDEIVDQLKARIEAEASECKIIIEKKNLSFVLGRGRLTIGGAHQLKPGLFPRSRWNIYAKGWIKVETDEYCWSASLWYGNWSGGEDCRWFEVSYMDIMSSCRLPNQEPSLLDPEKADLAACNMITGRQIAWGPHFIDDEDSEKFQDRYIEAFGKAAEGCFQRPRKLPVGIENWP